VVVVGVDYAGDELWVYGRKGLWSIGMYCTVKHVIESWCKDVKIFTGSTDVYTLR